MAFKRGQVVSQDLGIKLENPLTCRQDSDRAGVGS